MPAQKLGWSDEDEFAWSSSGGEGNDEGRLPNQSPRPLPSVRGILAASAPAGRHSAPGREGGESTTVSRGAGSTALLTGAYEADGGSAGRCQVDTLLAACPARERQYLVARSGFRGGPAVAAAGGALFCGALMSERVIHVTVCSMDGGSLPCIPARRSSTVFELKGAIAAAGSGTVSQSVSQSVSQPPASQPGRQSFTRSVMQSCRRLRTGACVRQRHR
jgi:hypothetical protein